MELLNDVRNYENLKTEEKNTIIAFLTALSALLSVLDSIITKPFLIKIGLANIITLILINEKKYLLAFIVILSRVFVASIIMGTLLSLTFLLSLTGGIISIIFAILAKIFIPKASLIGISVIGSFFHIIGQGILLVIIFGMTNTNIFIISIFLIISIFTGIITGILGNLFYRFA